MTQVLKIAVIAAGMLVMLGCEPQDRTPGLWLRGEAAEFPADWRFVDDQMEIAIQVSTPYLLPHSVTIWCVEVDGRLYVAAGRADTKNWPGWVDADPNVRLKIEGRLYDVSLVALSERGEIQSVQAAYAAKYDLGGGSGAGEGTRYWRVEPALTDS